MQFNYWFLIVFFLLTNSLSVFGAKVQQHIVYSQELVREVSSKVIIPDSYESSSKEYAVIYLLHGYGAGGNTFVRNVPELLSWSDQYDLIIICPSLGRHSWYLNSSLKQNVEACFIEEVLPKIEAQYRISEERQNRAIAGISMGGYGAMSISINNLSLFGFVSSISGVVDLREFPDKYKLSELLGDYDTNSDLWDSVAITNRVDSFVNQDVRLQIYCGKQDFLFAQNSRLHLQLDDCAIEHQLVLTEGSHEWDYWRKTLKACLLAYSESIEIE